MAARLHEDLMLYSTDEKFFVVASQPGEVLEIDRMNFDLKLINVMPTLPPNTRKTPICAIIGIIHLLAGPYLLIMTEKQKVGRLDGHDIWEMKKSDVLPFVKTTIHLNDSQVRDNKEYVALVQHMLSTPGFYFSYTYDLTHTQQRIHYLAENNNLHSPLHERADDRFVWNQHVLRDFAVQPELRRFTLPILHGFVSINEVNVNRQQFTLGLISRRSTFRAGTRYYCRGVDQDGHAANYVETEQIVIHNGQKASFVQTRGSIPLFWSQKPCLIYKPTPSINNTPGTSKAVQRHFDEQVTIYGRQVVVNLIDRKGKELKIGASFAKEVSNINNPLIRYIHFDFHKECSKMRWHRLSILLNELQQDQDSFRFFSQSSKEVLSQQTGVFRTNCMDCLDRSNVVQSLLAQRMLEQQLKKMNILTSFEKFEDKVSLVKTFKNVWADNADFCSLQYAGTGALKTDFTRTGKRTRMGALKDGVNSLTRYYFNNFVDGFRQDAVDLFLGVHVVSRDEGTAIPSILQPPRNIRTTVLPLILIFGLAMFFLSLFIPASDGTYHVSYILFWAVAVGFTLFYIFRHGTEFVNSPRLSSDASLRKNS